MNHERAFQLSTYLLLLTGFLSIPAAEGAGPVTSVIYLFALAISWFSSPFRFSQWQQAALVTGLCAVFVTDALIFSAWSVAAIRLLLTLSLLKIMTRRSGRDYLQIYLISLALLLVAATCRPTISYLIISIAFLYLSILTLILFENRLGYRKNPDTDFSLAGNFIAAIAITGLILLVAVPIFLAIPRGSVGLFGADSINVAGFSETVRLGEIGRILNNQRVVMRVKVNHPVSSLPNDLKWRGIALDYFDGRTWSHPGGRSQRVVSDFEGRFLLTRHRRQREVLLEQVFLVEPFSNVLFASPEAIQISGLGNDRFSVWQNYNDALSLQPIPKKPVRYFVHSDLRVREEKFSEARTGVLTEVLSERYLQLPPIDEKVVALAREITGVNETPIEKAVRVEKYLRENFDYTLENPSAGSSDPLAAFLFRVGAGHCEYFASAHAIMLRALSIPTRIVNGFRRGEYNEWGSYFIVRASDAHSWVEAYFPETGWIDFDPTPPVRPEEPYRALSGFARMLDSVEVLWGEVVAFDRFKQAGFFQLARTKLKNSWGRLSGGIGILFRFGKGGPNSIWVWTWSIMTLLIFCGFGFLVFRLLFRYRRTLSRVWKRRVHKGDETEFARDYYLEMLDLLREKGFVKSRFETPAEFARRVSHTLGNDLASQITASYYQTRFGGILLDPSQLGNVYSLLRRLRRRV